MSGVVAADVDAGLQVAGVEEQMGCITTLPLAFGDIDRILIGETCPAVAGKFLAEFIKRVITLGGHGGPIVEFLLRVGGVPSVMCAGAGVGECLLARSCRGVEDARGAIGVAYVHRVDGEGLGRAVGVVVEHRHAHLRAEILHLHHHLLLLMLRHGGRGLAGHRQAGGGLR